MAQTKLIMTERGEGEPVVLLHSGGMSSRQWQKLGDMLAPRWRVLCPDLLGSGANPLWPADAPFELGMDVDALVETLPADVPLHLVGHSYGAFLALKIALGHPSRVRSLALYEPPAFGVLRGDGDHEASAELRELERAPVFLDEQTGGSEPWMRVFVDYWSGPGAWDRLPEPARASFLRVGRKVFREVRSIIADRTPLSAYEALRVPVLLLSGETSPLAERTLMARLAGAIPNAKATVVASAGHMGPLTHGAEVNAAIAQHLEAQLLAHHRA